MTVNREASKCVPSLKVFATADGPTSGITQHWQVTATDVISIIRLPKFGSGSAILNVGISALIQIQTEMQKAFSYILSVAGMLLSELQPYINRVKEIYSQVGAPSAGGAPPDS